VATYGMEPEPVTPPGDTRDCSRSSGEPAELPPGGAVLRADVGGPIKLARFGDQPDADIGTLPEREWSQLVIPTDPAEEPWSISASGPLEICPLD